MSFSYYFSIERVKMNEYLLTSQLQILSLFLIEIIVDVLMILKHNCDFDSRLTIVVFIF